MKQNKNLQYLLIALVILVWGIIAYRIYQYLAGPAEDSVLYSPSAYTIEQQESEQDSFALELNYPDPFSGKANTASSSSRTRTFSNTTTARSSASTASEKEGKPPPTIIYRGYSINNNQVTRVRLDVNGQGITYRLNEEQNGVRVTAMSRDTIEVRFDGEVYLIARSGL